MEQTERLQQIAEEYGIKMILLFGSSVKGNMHAESDVDIAVLFTSIADYRRNLFAISGRLTDVFPDRKVDVAVINIADPLFLEQILRNCRLLYGEGPALAELKIYSFKRYQDHKRYLELEREYVHRVIGELTA